MSARVLDFWKRNINPNTYKWKSWTFWLNQRNGTILFWKYLADWMKKNRNRNRTTIKTWRNKFQYGRNQE